MAGALAWQRTNFRVVIDELFVGPPFDEDPTNQAPLTASDLQDFQPTGFVGLAYFNGPWTVGLSYRPPLSWTDEGDLDIEIPEGYQDLVSRNGNGLTFSTNAAGSLRAGVDYGYGEHPGRPTEPLFDVELNVVWEDWSRVDFFTIAPQATLDIAGSPQPLFDVYQPKRWQDTYSFRLGGSYGPLEWLTLHGGGSYETAAQDEAATNTDFVSWERITGSAGVTVHATDWVDLSLGYAYTYSGSRTVTNGQVFQQIPVSGCVGPDFTADACQTPGTPPGNPQNNGEWSAAFQIISFGTTFKFDP
ncbi:MAG: outer membrane protein transport protein [bacterium]